MKATVISILLMTFFAIGVVAAPPEPGRIWTTHADCGDFSQDVNHYAHGDIVYINGDGFNPRSYDWTVTGQPGGASCDPNTVVASGSENTDGSFCFPAYTVANDDCGTYTVDFGRKNDNYRVDKDHNDVPEFGVLAAVGVLGLAGLFVYRKRG